MSLLDGYTTKARLAPAVMTSAPELALGIALIPGLAGADRWRSVVGFAMLPFVALKARQTGNRVQPALWAAWGGQPTVQRLRFAGAVDVDDVDRRHRQLAGLLPELTLPSRDDELADAREADRRYHAAIRRLVGVVRFDGRFRLVDEEVANYGYCRNMLGLKSVGVWGAWITLVATAAVALVLILLHHATRATSLVLPGAVSVLALLQWRSITSAWVRLSADAYADRLLEAADVLSLVGGVRVASDGGGA